jgi:hypothetical protein
MTAKTKTETVTRYVLTFMPADGQRRLMDSMQGRYTYATPEEAQSRLDAIIDPAHNSPRTIQGIWGKDPRFEVRPVECYPGHFDPITCYFDDKDCRCGIPNCADM